MVETSMIVFEHGPYVQVAAFCDQVIEGKDGVLSLIRLVDTLTHAEVGPQPPLEMPPVPYKLKLVLTLKSGRARGRYEIRIVPRLPSGETKPPFVTSIHLEGDERGMNLIMDMHFIFEMEGLYWFDVYLDNRLITRLPFRTKYIRHVANVPQKP